MPARLSEEEEIGSAKYLPRELPARVFEEERFIFPQSYGLTRVRLLVKDPHWLFAHWDIDPGAREHPRKEKGERVAALARLTLRLTGAGASGESVVLPEGARSWYLRVHPGHGSYRVELGLTLPSGEYRPLAQSNPVSTPRVGPSPEKATRRISYRRVTTLVAAAPSSRVGGRASRLLSGRGRRAARRGKSGEGRAAAPPREPSPCCSPARVRPRAGEPATSSVDSPAPAARPGPGARVRMPQGYWCPVLTPSPRSPPRVPGFLEDWFLRR